MEHTREFIAGYRQAVGEATEPFPLLEVPGKTVNNLMEDRRKKLLTKKVTRWLIVIPATEQGCVSDPARQYEYYSSDRLLYDSKESAEAASVRYEETFGIFPVEIEVPL